MSTLTKICVVVLFVLVLVASVVFVQQAIQPVNWKKAYNDEHQKLEVAQAQASNNALVAQALERRLTDSGRLLNDRITGLLNDLAAKDTSISKLDALLAQADHDKKVMLAELTGLKEGVKAQAEQNKLLHAELDGQRKINVELGTQLRETKDRINELVRNNENLQAQVMSLREDLAQRDSEIVDLRQKLADAQTRKGVAAGEEKVGEGAPKIQGVVDAVKGEVVGMNIGHADGIKKDMIVYVYRGANFVAHVRVAEVRATSCAGTIVDRLRDVQVNDKVTTSLSDD